MGKDKLRRFAENENFPNLIQPNFSYPPADHELKGKWHQNFFKNDNPIIVELGCGRGAREIDPYSGYMRAAANFWWHIRGLRRWLLAFMRLTVLRNKIQK